MRSQAVVGRRESQQGVWKIASHVYRGPAGVTLSFCVGNLRIPSFFQDMFPATASAVQALGASREQSAPKAVSVWKARRQTINSTRGDSSAC